MWFFPAFKPPTSIQSAASLHLPATSVLCLLHDSSPPHLAMHLQHLLHHFFIGNQITNFSRLTTRVCPRLLWEMSMLAGISGSVFRHSRRKLSFWSTWWHCRVSWPKPGGSHRVLCARNFCKDEFTNFTYICELWHVTWMDGWAYEGTRRQEGSRSVYLMVGWREEEAGSKWDWWTKDIV